MISYKKYGGMRFLRIGRLNISWSLSGAVKHPKRSRRAITAAAYERGVLHGLHKGATVERGVTAAFLSLRGDRPVYDYVGEH